MSIPVFRPAYGKEEIAAVTAVLKSGWVGLGPKTAEFEKAFAEYMGVKYAVGLNSCTAALFLAFRLAGVECKEVVSTPMTFVSTNHTILHNGGRPVFADIDPHTLCIDPASVERAITPRTKAIVAVHYGGHACDLDSLMRIARRKKLLLIEDVAHGCGGEYHGRKLGTFGAYGCYSFHAVKNLATGEGGMITTDSKSAYEKLLKLRWLGISKGTWARKGNRGYAWRYDVREAGFKLHMSDINAAIGIEQLKKLDVMNGKRRALAMRYGKALEGIPGLELPVEHEGAKPSWHNYVVKTKRRDDLNRHLAGKGVATGVHYIPNNQFAIYRSYGGPTPVCRKVWSSLLTLPLYPELKKSEQDFIIREIRSFLER